MMEQLVWYDQVMRTDDFVIGCTLFVMDLWCYTGSCWWAYDVGPLTPLLISYMKST